MYAHIYICTYTYIYIYTCLYIYIYICIYIYVYTYTRRDMEVSRYDDISQVVGLPENHPTDYFLKM